VIVHKPLVFMIFMAYLGTRDSKGTIVASAHQNQNLTIVSA